MIAGAVTVVGAGVYLTQRSEAETTLPQDASLRVDVKKHDFTIEVIDTGKVQPKERVEIKSKVAGQVIEVFVEEGDVVKKGQLLLRLDPTDFERDVARADAEVAQAKNALEYSQLTFERKKRALSERGVAQIEVDLAANEVKTKTIALKSAEIALATARDRLRYTQVAAPLDGTVIELGIEVGEVVTPGVQQTFEGRPLLTIGDLSTLIVRSELNQIDIAKIALGQEVTLTFDALPGKKYQARVTKSAPAAVKPKGKEIEVFPVEATLVDADPSIKPGMTADVRFQIETKPNVFAVPIEAVVKESGKAYVNKIVLADGREKTEKTEVTVGARNDRELEVAAGLSEGDKLLINPASAKENEVEL
jgi:RND family efflux transporter MFP subunit